MTGCRDMDKKHQKYPQNGGFPLLVTPQYFFQRSGSATFVSLWCPIFMQKIRKKQRAVSEISKDGLTDGRTDKCDYHGPNQVIQQFPWLLLPINIYLKSSSTLLNRSCSLGRAPLPKIGSKYTHFLWIWFKLCMYSSRSARRVSQMEALSAKPP